MTAEFTGERVVPGQVGADLWNEHISRYAFAGRLVAHARVLDAGCGAGYGTAELARTARSVVGVDLDSGALALAQTGYGAPGRNWARASCTGLPFRDASFDAVVAFEVIEHLQDWPKLVSEAKRVLTSDGWFIVSTPNKVFYEVSRKQSGPNPFHEHEFEFAEFREMLSASFPEVTFFLQDHVEGVVLSPVSEVDGTVAHMEGSEARPQESSFFVAVCGQRAASPEAFVYIPRTANAVREKLLHIERLEDELAMKNEWLASHQAEHRDYVLNTDARIDTLNGRVVQLQEELSAQQRSGREMAAQYERLISELNAAVEERTRWGQETERRLTDELEQRTADLYHRTADLNHHVAELGRCVEVLHQTEATLEERTRWALELNERSGRLQEILAGVSASRWVRLGRLAGIGPELSDT